MLRVDPKERGQSHPVQFVGRDDPDDKLGAWVEEYIPKEVVAAPIAMELLWLLEDAFVTWGRKMRITSGYRLPRRNVEIGAREQSGHTMGFAVDVKVEGVSVDDVFAFFLKREARGIIKNETFVHVDMLPRFYRGVCVKGVYTAIA